MSVSNAERDLIRKFADNHKNIHCLKVTSHIRVSLARQDLEYNCLLLMEELCPGGAPKPYAFDKELHIIAMEYVEGESLQKSTTHGNIDIKMAEKLGSQIGHVAYKTHRKIVPLKEWQEYQKLLDNSYSLPAHIDFMATSVENYDVSDDSHSDLRKIENKEQFISMQKDLKASKVYDKVRELYTRQDCFGNSDLHGYSLILNKERCAMIDFEFGGLTSQVMPLGKVMTAYYVALYDERNINPRKKELLRTCFQTLVEAFLASFENSSIIGPLDVFFNELALAFGHSIFVLCISAKAALTPWYTGSDEDKNIMREKAFYLMQNYQDFTSIDKLTNLLFD